jgi:hypothetical protein
MDGRFVAGALSMGVPFHLELFARYPIGFHGE